MNYTPPTFQSGQSASVCAPSAKVQLGKRCGWFFGVFFALLLSGLALDAADAGTGILVGRVSNKATGKYLENVLISVVEDPKALAVTDDIGNYRLSGLKPGTYTVEVTYTGLDAETRSVVIEEGQRATANFDLTAEEIYVMDQVVIEAEREGQSKAIQDQRESDSSKYVVAADNFGNIQNGNIGEVMKQIPGFMVHEWMGEPVSMSVRGLDPSALPASVMVNGNSTANASSGGVERGFGLKGFNVDNIAAVEVWKASTPAQPGNSLGGAVNFTMKSAFQQKGRRMKLAFYENFVDDSFNLGATAGSSGESNRKFYPGASFYYSEAFGTENPVGIMFTASADRVARNTTRYQLGQARTSTLPTGQVGVESDPFYPNTAIWNQLTSVTANTRFSLTLDHKLTDDVSVYVNSGFTKSNNVDGGGNSVSTVVGTPSVETTRDRLVAEEAQGNRLNIASNMVRVYNTTWNINPGVKQRIGELTLAYDTSYSWSKTTDESVGTSYQLNPDNKDASNRVAYVVDDVNNTGGGTLTQTSGVSMANLDNYGQLQLRTGGGGRTQAIDERIGGKIDLKRPYVFRFPLILQSGLAYNEQNLEAINPERFYLLTGADGVQGTADDPALGQFANTNSGTSSFAFQDSLPSLASWINPQSIWNYFQQHPEMFREDFTGGGNDVRELNGRKSFQEKITAGYFMGTIKISALTVLAGVRYELTEDTGSGVISDAIRGSTNSDDYIPGRSEAEIAKRSWIDAKRRYDNWFPSVHLKYEPWKQLVFRASVNENIGRPNLSHIIPADAIDPTANTNQGRITRTNPNLDPQVSRNYEASVEYYFKHAGVLSVSYFRKDIKKYILSLTSVINSGVDNGFGGDFAGYDFVRSVNAGLAVAKGVEVAYHQQLRFLPGVFRNLMLDANYTTLDSEIDRLGNGAWTDQLPDFVPNMANITFAYAGKALSWQMKGNYRDRYLKYVTLSSGIVTDASFMAERTQFDFSMSYKLSPRWIVSADCRNILDEGDKLEFQSGILRWYDDFSRNITLTLRTEF